MNNAKIARIVQNILSEVLGSATVRVEHDAEGPFHATVVVSYEAGSGIPGFRFDIEDAADANLIVEDPTSVLEYLPFM